MSAGLGRTGPMSESLEDSGWEATSSSERHRVGNAWPFFKKTLVCIVCLTEGAGAGKRGFQPFWGKLKQICINDEFVTIPGEGTLPTTAINPPSCVKSGCHVCTVYFL